MQSLCLFWHMANALALSHDVHSTLAFFPFHMWKQCCQNIKTRHSRTNRSIPMHQLTPGTCNWACNKVWFTHWRWHGMKFWKGRSLKYNIWTLHTSPHWLISDPVSLNLSAKREAIVRMTVKFCNTKCNKKRIKFLIFCSLINAVV